MEYSWKYEHHKGHYNGATPQLEFEGRLIWVTVHSAYDELLGIMKISSL